MLSDKKRNTPAAPVNFKDDNRLSIMKKLEALEGNKKSNFELLSKDGNPLLQKLAQSIKDKVETHRSGLNPSKPQSKQSTIEKKNDSPGKNL